MAAKEVKRQKTAKKLPRLPPHTLDNPSDLRLTLRQEMELYETILLMLRIWIRGFLLSQIRFPYFVEYPDHIDNPDDLQLNLRQKMEMYQTILLILIIRNKMGKSPIFSIVPVSVL